MNQLRLHRHLPSYGTEDTSRDCRVCLSRGVARQRHRHFSTAFLRQRCIAAGRSNMECPVCQDLHTTDIDTDRLKTIMSSSTLNGFWKDKEWKGSANYHVEHEAVGGLKILGGRRIWRQLYDDLPKNVDTHLTIGLNDVLQISQFGDDHSLSGPEQVQKKVDIFMTRVEAFYATTQQHARRHKLDSPNRFSISSLLRPPQLYQFPGNPQRPGPHYNPLLDGINAAIDAYNAKIRAEHNERVGGNLVPGMDMWGLRTTRRKMQHVFKHFRENETSNMLHLVSKKQAMAAGRIVLYFQKATPNPTGQYRHKQPALSAGPPAGLDRVTADNNNNNVMPGGSGSGTVQENTAAVEGEAVDMRGEGDEVHISNNTSATAAEGENPAESRGEDKLVENSMENMAVAAGDEDVSGSDNAAVTEGEVVSSDMPGEISMEVELSDGDVNEDLLDEPDE